MLGARELELVCPHCVSALGRVRYRLFPAQLVITSPHGAEIEGVRAGQMLLFYPEWTTDPDPALVSSQEIAAHRRLMRRLEQNMLELVFDLRCPVHGSLFCTSPALSRAIRATSPDQRHLPVPAL